LYLGALLTLPLIGLGVLRLVTGRDWGAGLQLSWVLLAAATVSIFPELVKFLREHRRSWSPFILPLVLVLILSVAGLWIAPSGEPLSSAFWRYLKQVIQLFVMSFFVLLPVFFMAHGYSLQLMARVIVVGALGQGVYSLGQGVHFYHPLKLMTFWEMIFTSNPAILAGSEQLYANNTLLNIPRLRGTACEPLYLGNYLLLVLPLVSLTNWSTKLKVAAGVPLFALLVLTWSRGAWIAGMFAFILLIIIGFRLRRSWFQRINLKLVLFLVLMALIGLVLARSELMLVGNRLLQSFSSVDWSNLTRLYSMQAAWRAFLLSPVVGVGWGQFGFHFATLVDPMGLQSMFSWPVVNNFPLAILCETGVMGLGSSAWVLFLLSRKVFVEFKSFSENERGIVLLLGAAVIGVGAQLLTFSQYNLPHIWLSLGLFVGCVCCPRKFRTRDGAGT